MNLVSDMKSNIKVKNTIIKTHINLIIYKNNFRKLNLVI